MMSRIPWSLIGERICWSVGFGLLTAGLVYFFGVRGTSEYTNFVVGGVCLVVAVFLHCVCAGLCVYRVCVRHPRQHPGTERYHRKAGALMAQLRDDQLVVWITDQDQLGPDFMDQLAQIRDQHDFDYPSSADDVRPSPGGASGGSATSTPNQHSRPEGRPTQPALQPYRQPPTGHPYSSQPPTQHPHTTQPPTASQTVYPSLHPQPVTPGRPGVDPWQAQDSRLPLSHSTAAPEEKAPPPYDKVTGEADDEYRVSIV